MKRFVRLISIMIVSVLLFSTTVFAGSPVASGDAKMKLVEDNKATLTFGKYGWFEKKMEAIDTINKTVDLSLTVKNNAEKAQAKAGQVVLLIDNSWSMSDPDNNVTVNGKETSRKQLVIDSAKKLVNELYEANSEIEIGVVEFATSKDTSKWGTMNDAKTITTKLTNKKEDALTAIATVEADTMDTRTDIQAGLRAANNLLKASKKDLSQYIVVLTDAIPNVVLNGEIIDDAQNITSSDIEKAFKESYIKVGTKNLVDSRVESVKIYRTKEEQRENVGITYLDSDIVGHITYSVKPDSLAEGSEGSKWIAANGEISGDWVVNKGLYFGIRNNKFYIFGTSGSDSFDDKDVIYTFTSNSSSTANDVQDLLDKDKYLKNYVDVTKKELKSIKAEGTTVISMLIDMADDQYFNGMDLSYRDISEYLFGTTTNPVAGPVYYVTYKEIEKTVSENIYEDLMPKVDYSMSNIIVTDYIPKNIVDNFDYSIVKLPSKGKISTEIKADNSIEFRIEKLDPGETATVTFRLKLKKQFDGDIVGKNLPTNDKVTVDYEENNAPGKQVSSDKCPIIALDVEAKKVIPQTGENTKTMISALILSAGFVGVMSFVYYKKNRI